MIRLRLFVPLLMCTLTMMAQPSSVRTFSVLTYNCENAFDTIHDVGHNDYDYLPEGKNRWTRPRYFRKLRRIAQVIAAADTVKPVDIVVLEEVENDTVLTHLLRRTSLSSFGYEYLMTHNQTERGVDVALIYSPRTFLLIGNEEIRSSSPAIRPILHVWGEVPTGDTLDVYVLHLPSKLGARSADVQRRALTTRLRQHVDSVMTTRQHPLLLLAGDFNDTPRSSVCRKILSARSPLADKKSKTVVPDASPYTLYNMMTSREGGSYKYQGDWDWIDQVLLSGNLLRQDSRIYTDYLSVKALQLPFLLEPDDAYRGQRPFRTFLGPRYHGGYSDHLPVVVKFYMR